MEGGREIAYEGSGLFTQRSCHASHVGQGLEGDFHFSPGLNEYAFNPRNPMLGSFISLPAT